jgi:hypothetical protein
MLQLWFFANVILSSFKVKFGGLSLWLNAPVLLLAGVFWLGSRRFISHFSIKVLLLVSLGTGLSTLVALVGPCTDSYTKLLATAPVMVLLVFLGMEVGRRSVPEDWLLLQKTAAWCLLLSFVSFFAEMAFPGRFPDQAQYHVDGKYSGLFQEPSEVAFMLFPCIAVLLSARNKKMRRGGMLALFGLLILSRSSTLLALIVAWILYRLVVHRKLGQSAFLIFGFAAAIVSASALNYDLLVAPTVDRIVGVAHSSETAALSSLVYVQGWQDAWANLSRTRGLGLGFNMMGCHPLPDVSAREVLALGGKGEWNAEDGSFQFSKIVSEFGIAGLTFYVVIIGWWIRLEGLVRAVRDDAEREAATIQVAILFCFIVASFVRSASYFSGLLPLWVVVAGAASSWRRPNPAGASGTRSLSRAYSNR